VKKKKTNVTIGARVGSHTGRTLIDSSQGALKGFCMGISWYEGVEYGKPGVHADQEGFYVLEGTGTARIGDLEFRISPGSSFLACAGIPHTIKSDSQDVPVKVLWAHGAI